MEVSGHIQAQEAASCGTTFITQALTTGQADEVIEFIKSDSPFAETVNRSYAFIKETEKSKYLPSQIVKMMQDEGYKFSIIDHTNLWKALDAKNDKYNYGTLVAGKNWHWYNNWVNMVREHCKKQGN